MALLVRFNLIVPFDIRALQVDDSLGHGLTVFIFDIALERRNLGPSRAGYEENEPTQKKQTSQLREHDFHLSFSEIPA